MILTWLSHYSNFAGEFSPDDPYLLDSIAWGYYKMGDYVHANSTIARAPTLMPGEPGGFNSRWRDLECNGVV